MVFYYFIICHLIGQFKLYYHEQTNKLFFYSQVDLIPFFKVLENESQISSLILDYSISQTTLEEVFINVSL